MEESSSKSLGEATFSLKLLIDEKRNKVILAEVCRDFVDVLYSLLTLPIGTIVRLLEKHQQSQPVIIGCFNNLYKSVSDMAINDFETEACKTMLLYPRSTKEVMCRRLKLNIDDTAATKFFMCPNFHKRDSCSGKYSNFNTSRCTCGDLMVKEFNVPGKQQLGNDDDGIFVSCRSYYIVTDDLHVTRNSLGVITNVLNGLGYKNFNELTEVNHDVGFEEVMTLLGCLLTSEAPLTCTFLGKHCMSGIHKMLPQPVIQTGNVVKARILEDIKVFVRKSDQKILYAESKEDFVNALLTFLVLSLELAWSFSNNSTVLGCVGNLLMSECSRTPASRSSEIPYNYSCSNLRFHFSYQSQYSYCLNGISRSVGTVYPINPKKKSGTKCSGFLKRDSKFIVSDDLVVIPMRLSPTIGLLKNNQIDFSELEEHTISISKTELISILNASFISSSALTIGLSNLLLKKVKRET